VSAEESRGTILEGYAPLSFDGRRPHPLIRRAVGMIDNEQRQTLQLWRSNEAQDGFACAERADSLVGPALQTDVVGRPDHFQRAFVALGFRPGAILGLGNDLASVLRQYCRINQQPETSH